MNINSTLIAVVLDRSGSMQYLRESTITGLNQFLDEQRKLPGEAKLMLAQFDYEYIVHKAYVPLAEVKPLTQADYEPRGGTALYDAIGKTIVDVGLYLAKLPEADRPGNVVVVIQTDGQENQSTDYSAEKLKEMILHQQSKYSWQFVFLGANQDAVLTAAAFGIGASRAMTYNASNISNTKMFQGVSASVGSFRALRSAGGGASANVEFGDMLKSYVATDSVAAVADLSSLVPDVVTPAPAEKPPTQVLVVPVIDSTFKA